MSFLGKILSGNILYYPGCLTKFIGTDLERKNKRILRAIGIDFIMLPELELCCGSPVLKAGYIDDFKQIAEKNNKILSEHGVGQIITNCPACFSTFREEYQRILGNHWKIKVNHTSQVFHRALTEKRLSLSKNSGKITYHDPCHLGRQSGVYREPRELIKACGYDLIEMKLSRKDSYCCGGGGGVQSNEPILSNKIAQERIKQAREETSADIICTACPLCYLHLRNNSDPQQGPKIIELTELLESAIDHD